MNQRIKTIFADARRLDSAERDELAALLLATIDDDPGHEAVWGDEVHQRWKEHVQSGEKAVDAFAAIDEVRDRLHLFARDLD
jgi:Putative addiction module component